MNDYTLKKEKRQDENNVIKKCTDKKLKNPKFISFLAPLTTEKNIERSSECGDLVMLLADLNLENRKLHKSNFCGNRFCPMCSWRMSCKDSLEISILMEHLKGEESKEFIFLTLTTPNVTGDKLKDEITKYNKAFKKLMERKEVKDIVKGYIRKLEVTYQKEEYITKELWQRKKAYYKKKGLEVGDLEPNYDTYNPHFHVIIAVNKSYFTQTKQYINQERWLELWQESTNDYSITQVDVRKAKSDDYKAVYELAKYSAKDSDYLVSRKVFKTFYTALKGKQTLVFGGLFKIAHEMYKLHQLDIYKKQDNIEYTYMVYYNWHKKEYLNTNCRELSEEEKQIVNKALIDEMEVD